MLEDLTTQTSRGDSRVPIGAEREYVTWLRLLLIMVLPPVKALAPYDAGEQMRTAAAAEDAGGTQLQAAATQEG